MFWPQVVRGCAAMFCILPPTRLALGHIAKTSVPDASGLFNMMRNLGGAIGIALIDTIIYTRAPIHAEKLPTASWLETSKPCSASTSAWDRPHLGSDTLAALVQKAAFAEAINDAWLLLSLTTLLALSQHPVRAPAGVAVDRHDPQRPRRGPLQARLKSTGFARRRNGLVRRARQDTLRPV